MRRARPGPAPTAADLQDAAAIIARSTDPAAGVALTGDKSLLFDDARSAFITYGVVRCSWIAAGDPVGPEPAARALIAKFVSTARADRAHPAVYKASSRYLGDYLERGLTAVKIGELARIDVRGFQLAGQVRKDLRRWCRRAEEQALEASLLEPDAVPGAIGELRAVSDAWLRSKRSREKGFSLGFFDPAYLARQHVGIARQNGKVIAFSNLLGCANGESVEIDMMRFTGDAPPGTMMYLVMQMIEWARARGFASFSLGMAPLTGVESAEGAPAMQRLATLLRRVGKRYYDFEGLREFKQSFGPEWEPRYLISSPWLPVPLVLAHLTALVSRGPRHVRVQREGAGVAGAGGIGGGGGAGRAFLRDTSVFSSAGTKTS